jgi:hypothetical protein
MRAFTVLALAAVFVTSGAAAARGAEAGQRISVNLGNVPLRQALAPVRDAGLVVDVEPAVPDVPVSLSLLEVSAAATLRLMVRQAAAVEPAIGLGRDGERYRIRMLPLDQQPRVPVSPRMRDERLAGRADLTLRRTPLREALRRLLAPNRVAARVAAEVPEAPVDLSHQGTALDALHGIIAAAARQVPELQVSRERGVYHFEVVPPPPSPFPAQPRPEPNPQTAAAARATRVTVNLRNVPVRYAIAVIFRGTGFQYAVYPNVPDTKVTLSLGNTTVEGALQELARLAGRGTPAFTVALAGEVFVIEAGAPWGAR